MTDATTGQLIVASSDPPDASTDDSRLSPSTALRLAWMARLLLAELRATTLDERARAHFRRIYDQSIVVLRDAVGAQLASELDILLPELDADVPTQAELRVAQAQLAGWLEGLMQGVHATLWSQQLTAQRQLEEMRLAAEQRRDNVSPPKSEPYL